MIKRRQVYRVQLLNGRFDHVVGKRIAIMRAITMLGSSTPVDLTARELERDWGVRFTKVSPSVARSVGL